MKPENGHATTESLPWENLSSQVAGAVGELLRAQQELDARCRAAEDRALEIAQRELALEGRAAHLAAREDALEQSESHLKDRAVTLEQREQRVATLEDRALAIEAAEQEQRDRGAALDDRESRIAERETELSDLTAREAHLSERERSLELDRAACEESIASLADRETDLVARAAKLADREQAFEKVCSMLTSMTTALHEPTPENLAAAREATEQATAARPAFSRSAECHAETANGAVTAGPQGPSHHGQATTPDDDAGPDLSDLTEEEMTRMRMLRQLGTASLAEIVATIRAERTELEPRKKKRRQWPF